MLKITDEIFYAVTNLFITVPCLISLVYCLVMQQNYSAICNF